MTDTELDLMLVERLKAYEARARLPDGFKERLIGSVRRKRLLRRTWTLGLIGLMAVACVTIVHLGKYENVRNDVHPMLTANTAQTNGTTKVSYWMLIGYLRECLSRSRSTRRKEEE